MPLDPEIEGVFSRDQMRDFVSGGGDAHYRVAWLPQLARCWSYAGPFMTLGNAVEFVLRPPLRRSHESDHRQLQKSAKIEIERMTFNLSSSVPLKITGRWKLDFPSGELTRIPVTESDESEERDLAKLALAPPRKDTNRWQVHHLPSTGNMGRWKIEKGFASPMAALRWAKAENLWDRSDAIDIHDDLNNESLSLVIDRYNFAGYFGETLVLKVKCPQCGQMFGRITDPKTQALSPSQCPKCIRHMVDHVKDYLETGDIKKLLPNKKKKRS